MMNRARTNRTHSELRKSVFLGVFITLILAATPVAMASPRFGVSIHINVPARIVARDTYRYQPYYVGRVFYHPGNEWRFVYSFPVETDDGVVFVPYVYDDGRLVCQRYIPGPEAGYDAPVIEGRGYYDPHWYRGYREDWSYQRHYRRPESRSERGYYDPRWYHGHRDEPSYDRYDGHHDRGHHNGHHGHRDRDHERSGRERSD